MIEESDELQPVDLGGVGPFLEPGGIPLHRHAFQALQTDQLSMQDFPGGQELSETSW